VTTGYRILLLLHLLCMIGGAGGLAYGGLHLALGSRRGPDGVGAVEVQSQVARLSEGLLYAGFVFGIAAVGSSQHHFGFGQAWVSASIALFVVAVGLIHGVVRPAERRWLVVARELTTVTVPSPDVVPPQVGVLDGLAARVTLGWAGFDAAVVAVVVLMVFRPGA
jgi:hypothetical protein